MITDEQIVLVLKTFQQHPNPNDTVAMGKALEVYEQSKWVKVTSYETTKKQETTGFLPEYDHIVLDQSYEKVKCRNGSWFKRILFINYNFLGEANDPTESWVRLPEGYVTHWQPLPEFKE